MGRVWACSSKQRWGRPFVGQRESGRVPGLTLVSVSAGLSPCETGLEIGVQDLKEVP